MMLALGLTHDGPSDAEMVERLAALESARDEHLQEQRLEQEQEQREDARRKRWASKFPSPRDVSTGSRSEEDDTDTCPVCYGVKCHPTQISACSHSFCRLCAFKCRLREAGCPMCRAPVAPQLQQTHFPSELAFDADADADVAAHEPSAHREAVAKEEAFENDLRERHIAELPLVRHPGSIPLDGHGHPYQIKVGHKTVLTVIFSDPCAVRTLVHASSSGGCVGIIYPMAAAIGCDGFLARHVRTEALPGGTTKVRLSLLSKFTIEEMRNERDGGMVGLVTLVDGVPSGSPSGP